MSTSIFDRVCGSENLPSLPTVALEVLRLTRSEDASIDDILVVIRQDPALTARILKVVNSSLYGFSRQITSIKQAAVILGLRSIRVLALSFSLTENLPNDPDGAFDFESYWRQSLTMATAGRLLASHVNKTLADEAFVTGLLADLGMLGAYLAVPDLYGPVLTKWRFGEGAITKLERDALGVTHAELSRCMLREWGLPALLYEAVGVHHGLGLADLDESTKPLGILVFLAAMISDLFCGNIASDRLDDVRETCLKHGNMTEEALEDVLGGLNAHVKDMASMMSLDVGETVGYAQLRTEAMTRITQLTMQAEREREQAAREAVDAQRQANQLQEEKKAILEIASTDGLTGIANRVAFDQRLDEELDRAKAKSTKLGLIMLDVDHFKRFNDTYGHQAGDHVLKSVASRLATIAAPAGFPARYGGEEFAVIVPQASPDAVRALAEKIRAAIQTAAVEHAGQTLRVTASLGATWATITPEGPAAECLIADADRVLYQAKETGRNRVCTIADPQPASVT